MRPAITTLIALKARIADASKWTPYHSTSREWDWGNGCGCVLQHLIVVATVETHDAVYHALGKATYRLGNPNRYGIGCWNDTRTHAEVLQAVDIAMDILEEATRPA